MNPTSSCGTVTAEPTRVLGARTGRRTGVLWVRMISCAAQVRTTRISLRRSTRVRVRGAERARLGVIGGRAGKAVLYRLGATSSHTDEQRYPCRDLRRSPSAKLHNASAGGQRKLRGVEGGEVRGTGRLPAPALGA
jgi:hypothetical protein